jgi:ZIP family zinc transporter
VLEAFGWGMVGASALALGCALSLRFRFSNRVIGLVMAFASGVLISAVAYELVSEAIENYHPGGAAVGLFAGALVFFAGDLLITEKTNRVRPRLKGDSVDGQDAMPIVLGTVLDSIPESIVLGLTLLQGQVAVTILVAIWLANLPEALSATNGLRRVGWQPSRLFLLWGVIILASAVAAALGYGIFDGASNATVAFVLAFAGGAILTMLADSMMPDAFEDSGPMVGLVTTFGFATAYLIQSLE